MIKITILLFAIITLSKQKDAPEVTIEQGTLRGKYLTSNNGRHFCGFHRIPYAEPPVGELRFKPAIPAEPWKDVLDASKFRYTQCPQMNVFLTNPNIKGTEDCLYLNVYTPQLPDSKNDLLPVMVFIHGGGFMCGHADPTWFGPKILLDKDIVLVTLNYRLGALGFLSTEDEVLPGNNGLKDQTLALKWINKNIANFGGNPNKVTIFGQSSGGVSTHFHLLSPLSKDLIHGAIAQSGITTAKWALAEKGKALQNAKRLGELLNCPTTSSGELVGCLKNIDAVEIVKQDLELSEWSYEPMVPFKPVIEPNIEGAFLTEHPADIIKSGKAAKIPFITGTTTDEGAFKIAAIFDNSILVRELTKDFNRIVPLILQYQDDTNKDTITSKLKEHYLGNRSVDASVKSELTNLITDADFLYPEYSALELHAKYSEQPVYSYLFGFRGTISASMFFGDPMHDYGVCHMDELIYLFSNTFFPGYKPNENEQKIKELMTTLWTNFAKTGNPTPELNSLITNKWEPIEANHLKYYFITNPENITMIDDIFLEKVKFWKDISNIGN